MCKSFAGAINGLFLEPLCSSINGTARVSPMLAYPQYVQTHSHQSSFLYNIAIALKTARLDFDPSDAPKKLFSARSGYDYSSHQSSPSPRFLGNTELRPSSLWSNKSSHRSQQSSLLVSHPEVFHSNRPRTECYWKPF